MEITPEITLEVSMAPLGRRLRDWGTSTCINVLRLIDYEVKWAARRDITPWVSGDAAPAEVSQQYRRSQWFV